MRSSDAGPLVAVSRRVIRPALRLAKVFRRRRLKEEQEAFRRLVLQSGLFDAKWYLARNLDLAHSGTDPLHHFVHHGAIERRDPSPLFETDLYVDNYPEAEEGFPSPFEHYVRVGRPKGYVSHGAPPYERWIQEHDELTPADRERIRQDSARSPIPEVAIVQVVDDAACARLPMILEGFAAQIGARWNAHLVPARSLAPDAWAACRRGGDPRVAFRDSADEVLAALRGEVVLLCLGPVVLRPHAVYLFGQALGGTGRLGAYADHDHLGANGTRSEPVFKPEMSPEYLRRVSYMGPVLATKRDEQALRRALDRASDRGGVDLSALDDLALALPRRKVARLPYVLFHVPDGDSSYPSLVKSAGATPAPEADLATLPSVDLIIPTRDRVELLRECVDSVRRQTRNPDAKLTITIVDNDSEEEETLAYLREIAAEPAVRIVSSPGRFNFSRINNDAASSSTSDVLVFLNNDTTVLRPDWLLKLVELAAQPDVGAVGAKLLYPDGTIQHGGVALGVQGLGAHRLVGRKPDDHDPYEATREMTSVTGACLAVRREAFAAVGGFDPVLEVAFNDVSLCAKLVEAGYRNLYVADALLVHHESKSRGFDTTASKRHKQSREAIYARTRFGHLFQADPSYSPNRSLQEVDALAFPPRVVRPWRRAEPGQRRVLFLSSTHQFGNGVPIVLAEQAAHFRAQGWQVIIGGPVSAWEIDYPGCERVRIVSHRQAASYAVSHGVDCVIVHTPPFFSIVRHLGADPPVYFMDHGEPRPEFFAEQAAREAVNLEKRFCAPMAKRVFTISRTVFNQQFRPDAIVIRNGNSHLASWSPAWESRRAQTRAEQGLDGRFVVLNVCRFASDDRRYKGVDFYVDVANEFGFLYPHLRDKVVFLLAGRGKPEDVKLLKPENLELHSNISDAEMQNLYAASDLYMNFSRWEGYNLGIGQALAMGLPVIASDIEAHREFAGVVTTNDVLVACMRLAERAEQEGGSAEARRAIVDDWRVPVARLEEIVAGDLAAAARSDR